MKKARFLFTLPLFVYYFIYTFYYNFGNHNCNSLCPFSFYFSWSKLQGLLQQLLKLKLNNPKNLNCLENPYYTIPTAEPIKWTMNATTQAITHCHKATPIAHLLPSSLFTDAIAATQGEYSKLNTSSDDAASGVNTEAILPLNRTCNVDTTLSLAIIPEINEVQILQSPSPNGANIGEIKPEMEANILSAEFVTILK